MGVFQVLVSTSFQRSTSTSPCACKRKCSYCASRAVQPFLFSPFLLKSTCAPASASKRKTSMWPPTAAPMRAKLFLLCNSSCAPFSKSKNAISTGPQRAPKTESCVTGTAPQSIFSTSFQKQTKNLKMASVASKGKGCTSINLRLAVVGTGLPKEKHKIAAWPPSKGTHEGPVAVCSTLPLHARACPLKQLDCFNKIAFVTSRMRLQAVRSTWQSTPDTHHSAPLAL